MTVHSEKLSAYLDGELSASDMLEVERALQADPALRAGYDALRQADGDLKAELDALLRDPVPVGLARAINGYEAPAQANEPGRPAGTMRLAALAAAVALVLGATGGVMLGRGLSQPVVQAQAPARGWLEDVAQYHRIYAGQTRHLVEVPATEAAHIETWLSNVTGTAVVIPDLAGQGLTFEGGRLLVAAGKPVAQLIYTDVDGAVVALCLIRTETPAEGFSTRQVGGFDMVSWGAGTAGFVLIGDQGRRDLDALARVVAAEA